MLSEQILPNSIFYGTIVPALSFYFIKSFFIDPYLKKKEEEELAKQKEENTNRISEKRLEAATYRALMQETYSRIVERESQTAGLIIEKAVYGDPDLVMQYANETEPIPSSADAFDVTVAVQMMLADNSTLNFLSASKSHLPGFFDCNFGRPKKLVIKYRYHNSLYQVLLDDRESAALPNDRKFSLMISLKD